MLLMRNADATLQQEALHIVGVNLVSSACFLDPEGLLRSWLENLTTAQILIGLWDRDRAGE